MEIMEIVSYYIYDDKRRVEVMFRLTIDSDDDVRTDIISLDESKDYGYDLLVDDFKYFGLCEDDIDDEFDDEDFETIDEDLLLSYLNEYYIVNPNKIPKAESF